MLDFIINFITIVLIKLLNYFHTLLAILFFKNVILFEFWLSNSYEHLNCFEHNVSDKKKLKLKI